MKKSINILYAIFLVVSPFVLLFLPETFFDQGDTVCLSVRFFNLECYACGMTKAILHLLNFNFDIAYNYNKLSVIVLPVLILYYLRELRRIFVILF